MSVHNADSILPVVTETAKFDFIAFFKIFKYRESLIFTPSNSEKDVCSNAIS